MYNNKFWFLILLITQIYAKNITELKTSLDHILNGKNIDKYYQELYYAGKYKQIKRMYKYLKIIKSDYPKLVTARIYLWDGKYQKVSRILNTIHDKRNLEYVELEAYKCFDVGSYRCARKRFMLLFNNTGKLEYAYKLLDIYLYEGNIKKLNQFLKYLSKRYPNDRKLGKYRKNLLNHKTQQYQKLKQKYEKSGSFKDLQNLVYFLFNNNKKDQAYRLLETYVDNHPEDTNAIYWYAQYLSWYGYNKKAIQVLNNIVTPEDYKTKLLIAKFYAWDGNSKEALNYVNDIINNSYDDKFILPAKELKGLIYYWNQNYKEAKPLLKEVLKYKFSSEAKEALMVISGNIRPLIKKYKLLYRRNPNNSDYILRIADYSYKIHHYNTAIKFYEKYYKIKKDLNTAHILAGLYLIKKDYYKGFSYYEYWAYTKNDVKSLYELAQNYYYIGYYKSALKVISDLLKIQKYLPALKLRAKLLKNAPKFVQHKQNQMQQKNNQEVEGLLEMADRLYNNKLYKSAIPYYKSYLLLKPKDYIAREKYAYSLEKSGKYKEASGEFFLLTWVKKDCDILYNYGFSLNKSGRKNEAQKIFKQIYNDYLLKPLPSFLSSFVNNWKKAWESQSIDRYKSFYSKKYRNDIRWTIRKQFIFNRVKFISLYFADIGLLKKEHKNDYDYYTIKFFQQYTTNRKVDKGYKTLILKCYNKRCVIISEKWKKGEYKPNNKKCLGNIKLELNSFFK